MDPDRTMLNPPAAGELLAELAAFRARLVRLAETVTDWQARPAPDAWSLTEVACHLRDVEREVHRARIEAVLAEEGAFVPGVDADAWAEERHYHAQDGRAAALAFVAARAETIARLAPLSPALWQRRGQHTFFGPTTLHELVYLAVQHDRVHGDQIAELTVGQ